MHELWERQSGTLEADVAYLTGLRGIKGGFELRRRELARLEALYGAGYRANVERVVKEGWGSPLLIKEGEQAHQAGAGREAALAMIGRDR